MPLYEHVFLVRQDATAQQVEDLIAQYKGVIESNGGQAPKTEYWGVKTLQFRIKKNRKAHFGFFNLDAAPTAVTEMERQMRINEDILRFMTIRVDALEEGPSIMLQKRDRDERREERRGERRRERDREGAEGEEVETAEVAAAEEATP
jgi:small subunit ribosomal protein S6